VSLRPIDLSVGQQPGSDVCGSCLWGLAQEGGGGSRGLFRHLAFLLSPQRPLHHLDGISVYLTLRRSREDPALAAPRYWMREARYVLC
jgi:hypothetical protein